MKLYTFDEMREYGGDHRGCSPEIDDPEYWGAFAANTGRYAFCGGCFGFEDSAEYRRFVHRKDRPRDYNPELEGDGPND